MPLFYVHLGGTKVTPAGVAALRKTLPDKCDFRWDKPADVGKPWESPTFKKWEQEVATLSAEEQVKAVAKKLQELNPGFDGGVSDPPGTGSPTIKNGVVTELRFATDNVTDISPVRALVGLRFLIFGGLIENKSELTDLSPLKGTKLTDLSFFRTHVSDLSPLRGMPLTRLNCGSTKISDLSPLRGMPLTDLVFDGTSVTDVSPLEGMKLNRVVLTPKDITKGMDVIRQMNSLTTIGLRGDRDQFPPAEFWKKYDAGEFNK
jgi:Leucine-rich repeat (LRR) protein